MSRLLVLDYGSNSLRWLVVDRPDSGAPLGPVQSGGRSTGLGRPDKDGRLSQEAVERTLAATGEAVERGYALGIERIVAVATHFARELTGVEALAQGLKTRWGLGLKILTGTEEAWLTRVGVDEGLRCLGLDGRGYLAVDVGGGSTELSWWAGRELHTRSFPLGAIGLTSRYFGTDPPARGEMDELKAGVRAVFAQLPEDTYAEPVVASGGTATALAVMRLGLREYIPLAVHGTRLIRAAWVAPRRSDLTALVERLAGVSLAERRRLLRADPERAEVIVAGALVLETLIEHCNADGLVVSDYDLKHGAAIALGGDGPAAYPQEES